MCIYIRSYKKNQDFWSFFVVYTALVKLPNSNSALSEISDRLFYLQFEIHKDIYTSKFEAVKFNLKKKVNKKYFLDLVSALKVCDQPYN